MLDDPNAHIKITCTKKRFVYPDSYLIEIAEDAPIDFVVEQLGLFAACHSTLTYVRLVWMNDAHHVRYRNLKEWTVSDLEEFVNGMRMTLEIARKQWSEEDR